MAETDGRGRVDFLRGFHAEALVAEIVRREPERTGLAPDAAFDAFAAADPTVQKRYLQWLVRSYMSKDGTPFRFEDLGRVGDLLSAFDRWKHHLPLERRDIGRIRGEMELLDVVEPILERLRKAEDELDRDHPLEKRLAEAADRKRAMDGTDVLFDSEGWLLVRIVSADAAAWWARSTRWCTSDRETYASYRTKGPLVLLVRPDGRRIQMHFGHRQVMDERDAPASIPTHTKAGPLPESLRAAIVEEVASTGDPRAWTCVPESWIPDAVYRTSWRLILSETGAHGGFGDVRSTRRISARLVAHVPKSEILSLVGIPGIATHLEASDLDAAAVAALCAGLMKDGDRGRSAAPSPRVLMLLRDVGADLLVEAAGHGPMWPSRLRRAGLEIGDADYGRMFHATVRVHGWPKSDSGTDLTLSEIPEGILDESILARTTLVADLPYVADVLTRRVDLDAVRIWTLITRRLGPQVGIPVFEGAADILVGMCAGITDDRGTDVLRYATSAPLDGFDMNRIVDAMIASGCEPECLLQELDAGSPGFADLVRALVERRPGILVTHGGVLPKDLLGPIAGSVDAGIAGVLYELEAGITKKRAAEILVAQPASALLLPRDLLPDGWRPAGKVRIDEIGKRFGDVVLGHYLETVVRNLSDRLPRDCGRLLTDVVFRAESEGMYMGPVVVDMMETLLSGAEGAEKSVVEEIELFDGMLRDRLSSARSMSGHLDGAWSPGVMARAWEPSQPEEEKRPRRRRAGARTAG